ncbi:GNAT family N-acetyltransferase [Nostoc sp. FACHB-133]|uniref:GNAT family N-acetyltransferase n=1 Tax=Nostoc sp. FACHB-133 TaxID=2692835 RepID=UPI00168405A0|nr:GNAT family N-acyltransferase [Nostoc sp. FACHB-133]MBD2527306.1 GNAT family N-acetyltransferase [Nostoc sp. FACHB-133]
MLAEKNIASSLVIETHDYLLRLAVTETDLISLYRLRFEVFNLELGVGLTTSNANQLDRDKFDDVFHHLMIISKRTGQTIGTYRLQTYTMACDGFGFYSSQLFNLNVIPNTVLHSSVEVGRACVAKEYRNSRVFFLLWKGIAKYLVWNGKKNCFGTSCFVNQNLEQAARAYRYFQSSKLVYPNILVYPHSQYRFEINQILTDVDNVDIPNILRAYLRIGAKVCSLPAINREFKSIDFLTLFSISAMNRRHYQMFFEKEDNFVPLSASQRQ